jgi:hypothetical protein
MKEHLHSNFIQSSNLIFATVGLGVINFFFSSDTLSSGTNIAVAIITLLIILGIGILVRQGFNWVKYLLLVLTILGLFGVPIILTDLTQNPIVGIVSIVETVIEIWATVILFLIPKTEENILAEKQEN